MELTEREKGVVNPLVMTWIDADLPLPGTLSYQDVFDLLDKLGVTAPSMLLDVVHTVLLRRSGKRG